MDKSNDVKLTEAMDPAGDFVLSDLVGEFQGPSGPWDDYSGYVIPSEFEDFLFEQEITDENRDRLMEASSMAGLADECKAYFRTAANPSYADFQEATGIKVAKCYYDYYWGKFQAKPSWANDDSAAEAPAPVKEFDPSTASKELLNLIKLYNSADEKAAALDDTVREKFERVYDLAYAVSAKKSNILHAMICGDAGIGKTYEVNKAVNLGIAKSKLQLVEGKGDAAGRSITTLVQFMWENREGKLILMDDSDAILTVRDQGINNALKAFLDPDNPVFRMSSTINDRLNKFARDSKAKENKGSGSAAATGVARENFYIDSSRLRENVVSFYDNSGNEIATEQITDDQRRFYESLQARMGGKKSAKKSMLEKYTRTGVFTRVREADEDEWDAGDEEDNTDEEFLDNDTETIPIAFEFKSRTIFISNLKRDQLTDAVQSRFDIEEVSLTNEEFLTRLGQIIDTMNVNKEHAFPDDLANHGKTAVFALIMVLVEAYESGAKLGGSPVVLGGKLQFRIVPQLVDKWCREAEKYMEATKVTDKRKAEAAIQQKFIRKYALPTFANLRGSKRTN